MVYKYILHIYCILLIMYNTYYNLQIEKRYIKNSIVILIFVRTIDLL